MEVWFPVTLAVFELHDMLILYASLNRLAASFFSNLMCPIKTLITLSVQLSYISIADISKRPQKAPIWKSQRNSFFKRQWLSFTYLISKYFVILIHISQFTNNSLSRHAFVIQESCPVVITQCFIKNWNWNDIFNLSHSGVSYWNELSLWYQLVVP